MTLYFLRHGKTQATVECKYCGSQDLPLNDIGIAQIKNLAQTYSYPTSDRYYTSGMKRTEMTLELLYGSVSHEKVPALKETNFGAFEGHTFEELRLRDDYQEWISGEFQKNVPPGGESTEQVLQRALPAVTEIIQKGEDAVLVIHGGVIAALMTTWFSDFENWFAATPETGHGFAVTFEEDQPVSYQSIPMEEHK